MDDGEFDDDPGLLLDVPLEGTAKADTYESERRRSVLDMTDLDLFDEQDAAKGECMVDLRLRDGLQRPYPYLLDVNRIYGYTTLYFYRRGVYTKQAGEICLFGATFRLADAKREIYHIRVPNFTYYLRMTSTGQKEHATSKIAKWIKVANTSYTNDCHLFLRLETRLRCAEEQGHIREGTIVVGPAEPKTWGILPNQRFAVIHLRARFDYPQYINVSFTHSHLGVLRTGRSFRLAEVLGRARTDDRALHIPLLVEREAVPKVGDLVVTWDVAHHRYLRMTWRGRNLWRKGFVRSDPFLRIRCRADAEGKKGGKGKRATLYRSEGYRNTASPSFLPILFALPIVYFPPSHFVKHTPQACILHYDTSPVEVVSPADMLGKERRRAKGGERETVIRCSNGNIAGREAGFLMSKKVLADTEAAKPVTSLNDNDSVWPKVTMTETVTMEVWDNFWSRSSRVSRPTPMGEVEVVLSDIAPPHVMLSSYTGPLLVHPVSYSLLRLPRYDDDDPPKPEKADHATWKKSGRGADTTNAQSTVLYTEDARSKRVESTITLQSASLLHRASFLDFLKARWGIEMAFAFDFTGPSHQLHKPVDFASAEGLFDTVLSCCMTSLEPFTSRRDADLYGFSGTAPSGEYKVYPIHLCAPDSDDPLSSPLSATSSESNRSFSEGSEAPRRNKGVVSCIHEAYQEARDRIGRHSESAIPVFLVPVLRILSTRIQNVAVARKDVLNAEERNLIAQLGQYKGTQCPEHLLDSARYLEGKTKSCFGVGIIVLGAAQWLPDATEAVDELRAMERCKTPVVFLLVFLDCAAPPVFSNLLNCITVDINSSSPALLNTSLHLLLKGLAMVPSRIVDFLRLNGVQPSDQPPLTASLSPGKPQRVPSASSPSRRFSVAHTEIDTDSEGDQESVLSAAAQPAARRAAPPPAEEFHATCRKFNTTFARGLDPGAEGTSPYHRWAKGQRGLSPIEIEALTYRERSPEPSKPPSPTNESRFTVVDVYLPDSHAAKKEQAESHLRELASPPSGGQGLAALHAQFLRQKEQAVAEEAAARNTSHKEVTPSVLKRTVTHAISRKSSARSQPRSVPRGHQSTTSGSEEDSENSFDTDSGDEAHSHDIPVLQAQRTQGSLTRKGSGGSMAGYHHPHGAGEDETFSERLYPDFDLSQQGPLSCTPTPAIRPLSGMRYHFIPYRGKRAGGFAPVSRPDENELRYHCKVLSKGVKVDLSLPHTKQKVLQAIHNSASSIHAGPPIAPQPPPSIYRRTSSIRRPSSAQVTARPSLSNEPAPPRPRTASYRRRISFKEQLVDL